MILVAVIVGYILGVIPFVLPKIFEIRKERVETNTQKKDDKEQKEIFDEWLNGAKAPSNDNKVNQSDIFNEYITGEISTKGD